MFVTENPMNYSNFCAMKGLKAENFDGQGKIAYMKLFLLIKWIWQAGAGTPARLNGQKSCGTKFLK
jgi:hypothetical protein